jgi:ABC-2 type transport system ATP-binding protein
VSGVKTVAVVTGEDKSSTYEITTERSVDLRPELFRLIVDKGWVLLELHRDTQKLEDVFRDLTIGDERRNRVVGGGKAASARAEAEDEEDDDDDEDEEGEENS